MTRRAYELPSQTDGYRVLVDRLWPRGVKKEALALDEWNKDIAPSPGLRIWFGHDPEKFAEFTVRYNEELRQSSAPVELLKRVAGKGTLTLVYAAKDPNINHAVILQKYLEGMAQ